MWLNCSLELVHERTEKNLHESGSWYITLFLSILNFILYHNVLIFSSFKFILTCDYCLYQSQLPSALHQWSTSGITIKLKFLCELLSYDFPALNVSFFTLFCHAGTGVYKWHFFVWWLPIRVCQSRAGREIGRLKKWKGTCFFLPSVSVPVVIASAKTTSLTAVLCPSVQLLSSLTEPVSCVPQWRQQQRCSAAT